MSTRLIRLTIVRFVTALTPRFGVPRDRVAFPARGPETSESEEAYLTCMLMDDSYESLFTLYATTLFYWTLCQSYTDKKRKQSDVIHEWAAAVPSNVQPASRASCSNQPASKKARVGEERTTSWRSGFGIDPSRLIWPLSAKLWSRGMCLSSGQSR